MEVKIFAKLSAKLIEKVNQFELENFYTQEERAPEHFTEQEEKFFSQPKAWILVFERDQIIGRILLHKRKVRFNNRDVILGGIGGVCTRKDRREQGIATMMLKEAVKILKKWGCDIAYLCAVIEKTGSLYGQVGFVPLNKPFADEWRKHQGELRVIVARPFQRKGLGMIMMRELYFLAAQKKVEMLIVRMMRPQTAARNICHRLGFREELLIPDYLRDLTGITQDMVVMTCDMQEFWKELEYFYMDSDWQKYR